MIKDQLYLVVKKTKNNDKERFTDDIEWLKSLKYISFINKDNIHIRDDKRYQISDCVEIQEYDKDDTMINEKTNLHDK